MSTTLIIILVLVLIILIILIGLFFYARERVREFSKKVFDTPDIVEGFKKQGMEFRETPKSLSSLDSVLIPEILKDFPNLNIDEMKEIASNSVRNYYNSINKRELISNEYNNDNFNNMIVEKIRNIENDDVRYDNLKIHRVVINSYNNKNGSCVITFQMAIEYYLKKEKKNNKVQDRVNVDLIYVYDETKVDNVNGVSLNCKNCGAPIKVLGIKSCPYCGTGVVDYIPKAWKVNNVYNK